VIPLGFYTSIDEATLYTFTLAKYEGDFLHNNTVYLKDNYQNITHNLTNSDYVFTSSVGEFNDRFEIVFQENTLSIHSLELKNQLSIIELGNNEFIFKTSNMHPVKSLEIYDVQGRKVYVLDGFENSATYSLPALHKATYIAKATMDNEVVVTKKMLKRF
jgi:uncharacterized protein YjfI (DUF2170 family)